MTAVLTLDRLAIHHINKNLPDPEYAASEKDVATLHEDIIEFFVEMSADVWNAPNTGATRSAKYAGPDHPAIKPTAARKLIQQIVEEPEHFFENSKALARLLHEKTPGQASSGLLAIMRLLAGQKGEAHVIILKVYHDDESFVRLLENDMTELEVETVENMLFKGIQKGACIPHPERDDYDLKIIDKQQRNDPARYFARDFLGCASKKSDEYQVKYLIPTLTKYAQARELPLESEKLPGVIDALQRQAAGITTTSLCKIVRDEKIFGDKKIKVKDFTTYIDEESILGPIDIPVTAFAKRGARARDDRRICYKFRDPALDGITLEGPPDKLSAITAVNGAVVTITIQTTTNGYTVHYG